MTLIDRTPETMVDAGPAVEAVPSTVPADLLIEVAVLPETFEQEGMFTGQGVNTITGYNIRDVAPYEHDESVPFEARLKELDQQLAADFPDVGEADGVHREAVARTLSQMALLTRGQ